MERRAGAAGCISMREASCKLGGVGAARGAVLRDAGLSALRLYGRGEKPTLYGWPENGAGAETPPDGFASFFALSSFAKTPSKTYKIQ